MAAKQTTYTCNEYRAEMILLSLHRRLDDTSLSDEEHREIRREIHRLESEMKID